MEDKIYYIVRDKISGKTFKGSGGTGTSTFYNNKTTAPKLYSIGQAKSNVTSYMKWDNGRGTIDLEIIPVKIVLV